MGDNSINLVFSVDFCQCLLVKSRHLIRPVASLLGGMRPRIIAIQLLALVSRRETIEKICS